MSSSFDDPPCIVGVSCRLPGGVQHFDAVWSLFSNGDWTVCGRSPPPSRNLVVPDLTLRGGWIGEEGVEKFDGQFFGFSDEAAKTLRPNIRLGLELTYEALESAGIPPSSLRGKNVAVVTGVGTEDGWDLRQVSARGRNAFDCHWAASSDPSGVSGHISHFFDLGGSSLTVSAACASGAFALRDGIHALCHEDTDTVVVGSLTTHFSLAPFAWAHATGVASPSARCSAFSPSADGYVPSEGAVFFILKRLSTAQAAGDPIFGVVTGLATGHNGWTSHIMTPNPVAQIQLFRKAHKAAKITAEEVTLIEGHGTGTLVGDTLEAESLQSVFASHPQVPIILSSSKTVVGHCHGAAAAVGIMKILTCMEHRTVPPHHALPHSKLFDGSAFVLPVDSYRLHPGKIVAQVNAFGFTGSIASIIIQEPPPPIHKHEHSSNVSGQYLLPFSAQSTVALNESISQIVAWAVRTGCALSDLAAILSITRDHLPLRRAFIVRDMAMLHSLTNVDFVHSFGYSQPDSYFLSDILNLEGVEKAVFTPSFSSGDLQKLVAEQKILEAALHLYERGHSLHFHSVYHKKDIDPTFLKSFPHYPFDRRRLWQELADDGHPVVGNATLLSTMHDQCLDQTQFERLICMLSEPFLDIADARANIPSDESATSVLLTGSNGLLGSQLLERLLTNSKCIVYCIIRGNPWIRLKAAFSKNELDHDVLERAHADGRLRLLSTTDICGPHLGLVDDDYHILLATVDHIVHAAWNVDFNLPIEKFYCFLSGIRHLVHLCLIASKIVRMHFIGSYASTFNFDSNSVPEGPVDPRLAYSLAQGYAISKMVAEQSLVQLYRLYPDRFRLSIIRVGQICGKTTSGLWSDNEMMPMIIASLPVLKAVPANMPPVSWIPSDVCASALQEMVLSPSLESLHFLHVANPSVVEWRNIATQIGCAVGMTEKPKFLSLAEYIGVVQVQPDALPVSRLLPYLLNAMESGTMPECYASLQVERSLDFSPALRDCPPIAPDLLSLMVRRVIRSVPTTIALPTHRPVYLFGPWAGDDAMPSAVHDYFSKILQIANEVQEAIGVEIHISSYPLGQQLKTLASQLCTLRSLEQRGVKPIAAIGYCFGEYAASIAAGVLSERSVVEILVRRAAAILQADTHGEMLNVFADGQLVRRCLSAMVSPPCIAINVGPTHVVLSGSALDISSAESTLKAYGAKCAGIETTLPFHSPLMDESVRCFSASLPSSSSGPSLVTDVTDISFISCVTSGPLPGHKLDARYWMRHLRDPVDFLGAMRYVHEHFSEYPWIDMGPGRTLTNIIGRYKWDNVSIFDPTDETSSMNMPAPPHPPKRSLESAGAQFGTTLVEADSKSLLPLAMKSLEELFGYRPSQELCAHSLQSLGLQSMDFIRFADYFKIQSGKSLPLSAFVSGASLQDLFNI